MKSTFLLCLALLGMTSLALADKTVKYPKTDSMLSLTLPDGWESKFKGDALFANPEDDDSLFIEVTPLEATKKEGAKAIAEIKKSIEADFKNVKYDPINEGGSNGLGLYVLNAEGEDDDGKAFLNAIMISNPDNDQLFLLLCIASPEGMKEHGAGFKSIIDSIKKAE